MITGDHDFCGFSLRVLARVTVAVVAVTASVLFGPVRPALAGQWMQALCQNPDGSPAPIEGFVLSSENAGTAGGAQGGSSCPGGLTGTQPVVPSFFSAGGGSWAEVSENSAQPTQSTWTYTAPAGSTIAGGSMTGVQIFQETYGLPLGDFDAWAASPGDQSDAADLIADCRLPAQPSDGLPGSDPCARNPEEQAPRAVSGLDRGGSFAAVPVPVVAQIDHPGGTHLFVTAACSVPNSDPCYYTPGSTSELVLFVGFSWADILLRDNSEPTATDFGGSIVAPGSVHGTAHLTFTASDPAGPGVYKVTVKIDGTAIYSATPSGNGGECNAVGTDPNSGALIFDYQQPCPTSEQLDVPVDTTNLSDGDHDLQVIVEDAAENVATALDQTFTTQNATTVASAGTENPEPASAPVPAPPVTSSPTTSSPTTPGPITPGPAPVYALRLDRASRKLETGRLRRRYLGSTLVLSGTIVGPAGVPVPGTRVIAEVASLAGGGFRKVASAITDGSGRFKLKLPRGDSRRVKVFVGVSSVGFKQYVRPNLSLTVRALRHERLVFSGRLEIKRGRNPAPIVELADRTTAGWQPIANVPVGRNGRYRYTYSASRLAKGLTFQIRATTPATVFWQSAASRASVVKVN